MLFLDVDLFSVFKRLKGGDEYMPEPLTERDWQALFEYAEKLEPELFE